MSYSFPEGSKFFFSQTFAAAVNITAFSNADPAAATAAAHGFNAGAEVLITTGWEDASDAIFKVNPVDANDFSVLGLDTTDTTWYNPGGGVGTAQLVSDWIEIPQVLTIQTQGGDPKYTTINPLARRNSINVPVAFNPTTITLELGHDATNANYQTMLGISRSLKKVGFKMVLSGGVTSYGYGYMSVSEMPKLNVNQVNTVTASLSLQGRSISYGS